MKIVWWLWEIELFLKSIWRTIHDKHWFYSSVGSDDNCLDTIRISIEWHSSWQGIRMHHTTEQIWRHRDQREQYDMQSEQTESSRERSIRRHWQVISRDWSRNLFNDLVHNGKGKMRSYERHSWIAEEQDHERSRIESNLLRQNLW